MTNDHPLSSDNHTEPLIGAAEAEGILGINRPKLHREVHSGNLPIAQKLPGTKGAYLFHRADVQAAAVIRREALLAAIDRMAPVPA